MAKSKISAAEQFARSIKIYRKTKDGGEVSFNYPFIRDGKPFLHDSTEAAQEFEKYATDFSAYNSLLANLNNNSFKYKDYILSSVNELLKRNNISFTKDWINEQINLMCLFTMFTTLSPAMTRLTGKGERLDELNDADMRIITSMRYTKEDVEAGLKQYEHGLEQIFKQKLNSYLEAKGSIKELKKPTQTQETLFAISNMINMRNAFQKALDQHKKYKMQDVLKAQGEALNVILTDLSGGQKATRTVHEKMLNISKIVVAIEEPLKEGNITLARLKKIVEGVNKEIFSKTKTRKTAAQYGLSSLTGDASLLIGYGFELDIAETIEAIDNMVDKQINKENSPIIQTFVKVVGESIVESSKTKGKKVFGKTDLQTKFKNLNVNVPVDLKGKEMLSSIVDKLPTREQLKKVQELANQQSKIERDRQSLIGKIDQIEKTIDETQIEFRHSIKSSYARQTNIHNITYDDSLEKVSSNFGIRREDAKYIYYNDILANRNQYRSLKINYTQEKMKTLRDLYVYANTTDVLENLIDVYIGSEIDTLITREISLPINLIIFLYAYGIIKGLEADDSSYERTKESLLETLKQFQKFYHDAGMRIIESKAAAEGIHKDVNKAKTFFSTQFNNTYNNLSRLIHTQINKKEKFGIDFVMSLNTSDIPPKDAIRKLRENPKTYLGATQTVEEYNRMLEAIGNMKMKIGIR